MQCQNLMFSGFQDFLVCNELLVFKVETNQRRIAALTNGINRTGEGLDDMMNVLWCEVRTF